MTIATIPTTQRHAKRMGAFGVFQILRKHRSSARAKEVAATMSNNTPMTCVNVTP